MIPLLRLSSVLSIPAQLQRLVSVEAVTKEMVPFRYFKVEGYFLPILSLSLMSHTTGLNVFLTPLSPVQIMWHLLCSTAQKMRTFHSFTPQPIKPHFEWCYGPKDCNFIMTDFPLSDIHTKQKNLLNSNTLKASRRN